MLEAPIAPAPPPHDVPAAPPARILVVDVGGTNVKVRASGHPSAEGDALKIPSGPALTPAAMVAAVRAATADWAHDAVTIGYPGPVAHGRPAADPHNLAPGWVAYDLAAAFDRPVRIVNDAAMQALGGWDGGRMLFLGLGTGLGSALVVEGIVQPLELAHLPYRRSGTFEDYVGERGRRRFGKLRWRALTVDVVRRLHAALQAESVLIGGGNARRLATVLDRLPAGTRIGSNRDAFRGGVRLWTR